MKTALEIAQIGETILRQKAQKVTDFSSPELGSFIDDLMAIMHRQNGVGIAAPQVFSSKQIMIVASRPNIRYPDAPKMEPMELINPVIDKLHGERVYDWEGCLSVPGIRGWVGRYDNVDVSYQDRYGESHQIEFSGFVARIFQHEYDHLVGETFVDRVDNNRHLVADSVLTKILANEVEFNP